MIPLDTLTIGELMFDDTLPSLTIGYLILDDNLLPLFENKKDWGFPFLRINLEDLPNLYFMFLIAMKCISKLLEMFFMENIISRSPYPQKYFKNFILKPFSKNNFQTIHKYCSNHGGDAFQQIEFSNLSDSHI